MMFKKIWKTLKTSKLTLSKFRNIPLVSSEGKKGGLWACYGKKSCQAFPKNHEVLMVRQGEHTEQRSKKNTTAPTSSIPVSLNF